MFEYRNRHSKGFMHHNDDSHTSTINLEIKNNFDRIMEFTPISFERGKGF